MAATREAREGERYGWHSLRRAFANRYRRAPLRDLQNLGGWKSSATLMGGTGTASLVGGSKTNLFIGGGGHDTMVANVAAATNVFSFTDHVGGSFTIDNFASTTGHVDHIKLVGYSMTEVTNGTMSSRSSPRVRRCLASVGAYERRLPRGPLCRC